MCVFLIVGIKLPGFFIPGPAARFVRFRQRNQVVYIEGRWIVSYLPVVGRVPVPTGALLVCQHLAASIATIAVKVTPVAPVGTLIPVSALGFNRDFGQ